MLSPCSRRTPARRDGGMLSPADRPRRVGGGFASPSLTSPPHDVPASLAAQARVNRRLSEARARPSADYAAAALAPAAADSGDAFLQAVDAAIAATAATQSATLVAPAEGAALEPLPSAATPLAPAPAAACIDVLSPVLEAAGEVAPGSSPTDAAAPAGASPFVTTPAVAFCAASFDDGAAAAALAVAGSAPAAQAAAPIDGDAAPAGRIFNGVRLPFDVFTELDQRMAAARSAAPPPPPAPEARALPQLQPFSPMTVLRAAGPAAPLASPLLAMASSTSYASGAGAVLADTTDCAPADTPAVEPLVLRAHIDGTTLSRGFLDTHTDYAVSVTISAGATVLHAATVTRRYTDFLAFFADMAAADATTCALQAPASFRLRAAAARFAFPAKVTLAPWRDAVVRERAARFNALLHLVCCCVSGTTSMDHLPPFLRAFLAC